MAWVEPGVWRTESGWLLLLPGTPPSANVTTREHWGQRQKRLGDLVLIFRTLRLRAGYPALTRARLVPVLLFRRPARRDPSNYGAGLKQHVDAIVRTGWLPDDSGRYLTTEEPVIRRGAADATFLYLEELGPR